MISIIDHILLGDLISVLALRTEFLMAGHLNLDTWERLPSPQPIDSIDLWNQINVVLLERRSEGRIWQRSGHPHRRLRSNGQQGARCPQGQEREGFKEGEANGIECRVSLRSPRGGKACNTEPTGTSVGEQALRGHKEKGDPIISATTLSRYFAVTSP